MDKNGNSRTSAGRHLSLNRNRGGRHVRGKTVQV
jgi:hypothetical protein